MWVKVIGDVTSSKWDRLTYWFSLLKTAHIFWELLFIIGFLGLQRFTQITLMRGFKLSSLFVIIRYVFSVWSHSESLLIEFVWKEYFSSAGELCKDTGSQRELRTVRPLGGQPSHPVIPGAGAGHMNFLKKRSISKEKPQRDSNPLFASCIHLTPPKHQSSGWSHNAVAYIKSLTWRVSRFFEVLCWAAVGDPVTQLPLSSQVLNSEEPRLILGICFAWKHVPSVSAGLASCSQHSFKSIWAKSQWDFFPE